MVFGGTPVTEQPDMFAPPPPDPAELERAEARRDTRQIEMFADGETNSLPPITPTNAFDLYNHPCEVCGAYGPFGIDWPHAPRWFCSWHFPITEQRPESEQ